MNAAVAGTLGRFAPKIMVGGALAGMADVLTQQAGLDGLGRLFDVVGLEAEGGTFRARIAFTVPAVCVDRVVQCLLAADAVAEVAVGAAGTHAVVTFA